MASLHGTTAQDRLVSQGEGAPRASPTARVALVLSATALLLSGFVAIETLNEDGFRGGVDDRLACLEEQGANDCGVDGK